MVSTRTSNGHASSSVPPDPNRIIAVVTGANSGYGLQICNRLLDELSLPAGHPLPSAQPKLAALAPSLKHLYRSTPSASTSGAEKDIPSKTPALTLVLACRSAANAEQGIAAIRARHERVLHKRAGRGIVRDGWLESLRIEYELVDLDEVEGSKGMLQFCERLKARSVASASSPTHLLTC